MGYLLAAITMIITFGGVAIAIITGVNIWKIWPSYWIFDVTLRSDKSCAL